MSKPRICNGVLKICIVAGAMNWATLILLTFFSACSPSHCIGRRGAIMVGRLNEAKIVRQSRIVKRAYVGRPTGRGWHDDCLPNICVNLESL